MRLISSFAILLVTYQLAAAAPPQRQQQPQQQPPQPPANDFSIPQQDTRLIVVDFKIVESVQGKEQAAANPQVAVPIGQTGEVSIGNVVGGEGENAMPLTDKQKDQQFVGTRVMVTPVLRRDGKIQMTFKLRVSTLMSAPGVNPPKIDVREAANNAVASPGQTVGVSGFKTGDMETRITATPRIIDASAAMKDQKTR